MQQKDYLLREIEKLGLMLRMIVEKLTGKGKTPATSVDEQIGEAKGMLLSQAGLDLDYCFTLETSEIEQYISTLNGINGPNIELLADVLKVMGMKSDPAAKQEYLKRALKLYEICNSMDKTFSFDREGKIQEIKSRL